MYPVHVLYFYFTLMFIIYNISEMSLVVLNIQKKYYHTIFRFIHSKSKPKFQLFIFESIMMYKSIIETNYNLHNAL